VAEQPAVVSTLDAAGSALKAKLPTVPADQQADVKKSIDMTDRVVASGKSGSLPPIETANAMRSIVGTGVQDPSVSKVADVLGSADNYGGRSSFRACVPLAAIAAVVFAILFVNDRRRGGYRGEQIAGAPAGAHYRELGGEWWVGSDGTASGCFGVSRPSPSSQPSRHPLHEERNA
jgi:hypothetical protein